MNRKAVVVLNLLLAGMLLLCNAPPAIAGAGTGVDSLAACAKFAFSTEEDFVTQGPTPSDGNPIISDGDLLSRTGAVCLRNRELLAKWESKQDLGLDAADVIDVERNLVAFSTELDDPGGRFKAGDLLATNGAVIPVAALLTQFQVGYDMGLDAIHFTGKPDAITEFLVFAGTKDRSDWLGSTLLLDMLREMGIDIWFSTESTERTASTAQILDGDLLSVRSGQHVFRQRDLFPNSIPAGIVDRGVDFGLDAAAASRSSKRELIRFSTEILYEGEGSFTDGDVLRALTAAVEFTNEDLVAPFEPKARFLGLDALYMDIGGIAELKIYLPIIEVMRQLQGGQP